MLVVDDNPVNRAVATAMLGRLGCITTSVDGGRAALDLLFDDSHNWDLVLLDLQMPEVDGMDVIKQLRAHEAQHNGSSHQTVIALTAQAMAGDRERCLEAGMDDYLSKPLTLDALTGALKRWLNNAKSA